MTAFSIGAIALVALAWALLLPALRRRGSHAVLSAAPAGQANLAVLREQRDTLDAEHAAGQLDTAQMQAAHAELERRVLEETSALEDSPTLQSGSRTTLAAALAIPVFAVALYAALGQPAAITQVAPWTAEGTAPADAAVRPEDVTAMVDMLATRLAGRPPGDVADLDGWVMLARASASLQRFDEAGRAYAKAIELAPRDAQLLADRADVLGMQQGEVLAGEPTRLIEAALQIDPSNPKVLALAGSAAFERRDFATAIGHWSRARERAAAESAFAEGLDRSIAQARAESGLPAGSAVAAESAVTVATTVKPSATTGAPTAAKVSGQVRIDPALAGRIEPGDSLFIYARAIDGPRMPVAILKRSAAELPLAFTLDDSLAMSPELKLSNFARVVVSARVSRSGQALPQAGDLLGSVEARTDGGAVTITIDRLQP